MMRHYTEDFLNLSYLATRTLLLFMVQPCHLFIHSFHIGFDSSSPSVVVGDEADVRT
jgi:hypothetical protein